jgi:hypothetical protein
MRLRLSKKIANAKSFGNEKTKAALERNPAHNPREYMDWMREARVVTRRWMRLTLAGNCMAMAARFAPVRMNEKTKAALERNPAHNPREYMDWMREARVVTRRWMRFRCGCRFRFSAGAGRRGARGPFSAS